MKYFIIFSLTTYQMFISPFLKQLFGISRSCRFTPSCSEYAKQMFARHGMLKASYFSAKRLLRCQPFV